MKSTIAITVFAIGLLDHCAAVSIIESKVEYIRYFDPERPPVIETYIWDEKKHWRLRRVLFDSDGDWASDMTMHFLDPESRTFTEEELAIQRKHDEEAHQIRKDGVLLCPIADYYKNKGKLYRKADLSKALETDDSFREASVSGASRQLSVPTPEATENKQKRLSVAYRDLLMRLMDLKIAAPPQPPIEPKVPYLTPVPGNPGFYTYPGEEDKRMGGKPYFADCREFAPGTLVQSPMTHKEYRVPLNHVRIRKP